MLKGEAVEREREMQALRRHAAVLEQSQVKVTTHMLHFRQCDRLRNFLEVVPQVQKMLQGNLPGVI